jgi:hypothetical protein
VEDTYPAVFWLSGFTYPSGFLTAVLQTTARKNSIPIDTLSFEYGIVNLEPSVRSLSLPVLPSAFQFAHFAVCSLCFCDQKQVLRSCLLPVLSKLCAELWNSSFALHLTTI